MHLLIFDSGIGGLGVVREIRRLQPASRLSYLADNGFFPYGEKPDEVLVPRICGVIGAAIAALAPDAVVIACNTASTITLAALRAAHPGTPFIGCVPPVKPAAAASVTRHIGVLATAATVRRAYLQDLIDRFAPDCAVHSLGTPTLAALAEEKFRGRAVDVAPAIAPLFAQEGATQIDAIALGCTHYTFLLPEFTALHPQIKWFDPAGPVARRVREVTADLPAGAPGPQRAYFTGPVDGAASMPALLATYGFMEIRDATALVPAYEAARSL